MNTSQVSCELLAISGTRKDDGVLSYPKMDQQLGGGGKRKRKIVRKVKKENEEQKYVKKLVRRPDKQKVVRKKKQKKPKQKKATTTSTTTTPDIAKPAAYAGSSWMMMSPPQQIPQQVHQPMVGLDPLEQAKKDVAETMLDPKKRNLAYVRRKRLDDLMKGQTPTTYHSNTPLLPGLTKDQLGIPEERPARRGPLAPDPPPAPEDPVFEKMPQAPRQDTNTKAFLESTLQQLNDDRLRQIGFRMLDMSGLEVLPSQTRDRITLQNQKTNKVITMNKQEIVRAVLFVASDEPLVKADAKTRELVSMIDPYEGQGSPQENQVMMTEPVAGFASRPGGFNQLAMASEEQTKDMTESQKAEFNKELQAQEGLNTIREEFEPTRMEKRKQSWWEWMRGKQPEGAASVEQIANQLNLPYKEKQAAANVLAALERTNLLKWDEEGHMIDPVQGLKVKNSNLINILEHWFNPTSAKAQQAMSTFIPSGHMFFWQKAMELWKMNQRDPNSPLLGRRGGGGAWNFVRKVAGLGVNLISFFYGGVLFFNALGIDLPTWLAMGQWLTDADLATMLPYVRAGTFVGKIGKTDELTYESMAEGMDMIIADYPSGGFNVGGVNISPDAAGKALLTRQLTKGELEWKTKTALAVSGQAYQIYKTNGGKWLEALKLAKDIVLNGAKYTAHSLGFTGQLVANDLDQASGYIREQLPIGQSSRGDL